MNVTTLKYNDIIDLCLAAKKLIYLASPGIFDEVGETLVEKKRMHSAIDIVCVIDPTEDAIRKHHGEASVIRSLIETGVEVRTLPHHRLGFIITDEKAFLIFQTNRSVELDVEGPNAIEMPVTLKEYLTMQFFKRPATEAITQQVQYELDALIAHQDTFETLTELKGTPEVLDSEMYAEVEERIKKDPPKSPDTKRMVDVYATKIRFIELEVKGIHVERKTVKIPNRILNLTDEELRKRIKASISILDEDDARLVSQTLVPLDEHINEIRKEFLRSVPSRKKNVILVERLPAFKREIDSFTKEYERISREVIKALNESIKKLEVRLADEIEKIYRVTPPADLFGRDDPHFVRIRAEEEARKIPKPSIQSLVNSFSITTRAFDPTWNDFQDEAFANELFGIGFIDASERDQIVNEFQAFQVKR
jgi:hypothetical protein